MDDIKHVNILMNNGLTPERTIRSYISFKRFPLEQWQEKDIDTSSSEIITQIILDDVSI